MHDLLVVGAGPAGLAHAFWRTAAEPDLDVRVVEAAERAGGWVRTAAVDGFLCELGPQGIRPDADSDACVAALGLEGQVVPASEAAKRRFVARGGRLHPLPMGPGSLLGSALFTAAGKLRLCRELFTRKGGADDESLAGFVGRRFGEQAVPLAEALASGVFGGDAHALEMAAAFPKVAALERDSGGVLRGALSGRKRAPRSPRRPALHTFAGGMATLVRALADRLGARLALGERVVALRREGGAWTAVLEGGVVAARSLALAVPAPRAAALLEGLDPELAAELRAIPFASIANVHLGFRAADAAVLQGFGFLLDRREASPVLGAIYCSSVFPQSAPPGHCLVRVMAGGVLHRDAVELPDERLVATAHELLRRYTGLSAEPTLQRVDRARGAIPQYVRGHCARLRRIRARLADHPGLALLGNSYDEVSVVGQLRPPT